MVLSESVSIAKRKSVQGGWLRSHGLHFVFAARSRPIVIITMATNCLTSCSKTLPKNLRPKALSNLHNVFAGQPLVRSSVLDRHLCHGLDQLRFCGRIHFAKRPPLSTDRSEITATY